MKQQSHISTAIKALQRQLKKLESDRDRWESAEKTAQANKVFFTNEIGRLEKHIEALEFGNPSNTELALT